MKSNVKPPRFQLEGGRHEAFMAGLFLADSEEYMREARKTRDPDRRREYVRSARNCHKRYIRYTRLALDIQADKVRAA